MIATLHIQTAWINNRTYLQNSYCTIPFKVASITEDKNAQTLRLMLMSSSPGILDGDEYRIKIELAKNSSLQLHTQSYQRLFTMKQQALQQLEVHLADNTSFSFIPHPSVPHEQSNFLCRNKIYLSNNCSLIFGEILTCGRKLNGEVFLFSKFHTITEIFINNKLIIKENLLIQPSTINVNAIGQLQGYTHQASLIYLDESADIKKLAVTINELLLSENEISVGITEAPINGMIVRLLGQKAEQLFKCLKLIASSLPQTNHLKPVAYAI